jgi:hypothetical protein
MKYPKVHFPNTPLAVRRAVLAAIDAAPVSVDRWTVPMEAIAFYESGFDPAPAPGACAECRGMMQQSFGQYSAAFDAGFVDCIDYHDRTTAVLVAIKYIRSELSGFGGYGNLAALLARTDRGPGNVLRAWIADPSKTPEELRPLYRGY